MSFGIKEDRYAEEEIQARRDRRHAETGRCAGLAGSEHGRCDPPDWRERGGLRDELLNGEIFYTLREAQIIIESWCRHYNRASEHPSCYVIEEKRFCWPGCDPAGYLGFCRARSMIDRTADVVRAVRA